MSQSAMADQTGTVHFNGTVTSNTCTLSGQDITHDLGPFSTADSWASQSLGSFKQYTDTIKVTGCPASLSKVTVTPSYTEDPSVGNGAILNNGSATQVHAAVLWGNVWKGGVPAFDNGVGKDFTLSNGAVDVTFIENYRHTLGTTKATAGNMDFAATMAFAYQ